MGLIETKDKPNIQATILEEADDSTAGDVDPGAAGDEDVDPGAAGDEDVDPGADYGCIFFCNFSFERNQSVQQTTINKQINLGAVSNLNVVEHQTINEGDTYDLEAFEEPDLHSWEVD